MLHLQAGESLSEHEVATAAGERASGGAGLLVEFAPGERHEVVASAKAIRGLGAAASEHPFEHALLERERVPAAQLNGFPRCLEMQPKGALSGWGGNERFHSVGAWGHAPMGSERERAALVCYEELTLLAEREVAGPLRESVREVSSGDELCALAFVTVAIRGWSRFEVAVRAPVGNYALCANAARQ